MKLNTTKEDIVSRIEQLANQCYNAGLNGLYDELTDIAEALKDVEEDK